MKKAIVALAAVCALLAFRPAVRHMKKMREHSQEMAARCKGMAAECKQMAQSADRGEAVEV